MEKTERLFISVDVKITKEISNILKELKDMGIRPSDEKQIHITLSFLGDTPVSKIDRLVDNLRKELSGTERFNVILSGIGGFPNTRRPRVAWIGVSEGKEQLTDLSEKVRAAVRNTKLIQDDKRFSPHVTIARLRDPTDLTEMAERYSSVIFSEYVVDSVRLMKSVLSPSGAKHSLLASFELKKQS